MFSEDTTIVGLILDHDETQRANPTQSCSERQHDQEGVWGLQEVQEDRACNDIVINKCLSVLITSGSWESTLNLTWSLNTARLGKKDQRRLSFLGELKRAGLSPLLLTNLNTGRLKKKARFFPFWKTVRKH